MRAYTIPEFIKEFRPDGKTHISINGEKVVEVKDVIKVRTRLKPTSFRCGIQPECRTAFLVQK
jgi:hypothetical protein